jgi:hypothetical protein
VSSTAYFLFRIYIYARYYDAVCIIFLFHFSIVLWRAVMESVRGAVVVGFDPALLYYTSWTYK